MSAPEPSAPTAPQTFTTAAWSHLRDVLSLIVNIFGAPTAIFAMRVLTRKAHGDMRAWLSAAEAFVRRVLLIEASLLPRPNLPPKAKPKTDMRARHGKAGFASENSEDWSVTFKALPPARKKRKAVSRKSAAPSRFTNAQPLAERLEALLRVVEHPERYAQRLARKLYAKPSRAMRIPAQTITGKTNPLRTALAEAQPLAYAAAIGFRDSS